MKKILVISTLFLLTTIAQVFAVEFTFLNVNDKVVEYLNSVRSNPMDYIVNKSLDQSKIKNSWGDNYYNYFSSDLGELNSNNFLKAATELHIKDMFENVYFAKVSPFDNSSLDTRLQDVGGKFLYQSDAIMALAFENYVPVEKAISVMMDQIVMTAFYGLSVGENKGLLVDKYDSIGSSVGAAQMELDGKLYNVYLISVAVGLDISGNWWENFIK